MEYMPKVSIVIPVYNAEKYLDECLTNLVGQTLKEIEIICVNDASSDRSKILLENWKTKDERIRVYGFSENSGPWCARRLGIEKAKGKYLLFVDADDSLASDACEKLYSEMENAQVDILHFESEVINVNQLPEDEIKDVEMFLHPYYGTLQGDRVFTACFRDARYGFSLWNKMYRTDLCKKALDDIGDEFFSMAEDKLLYFILAYYAQSYKGISGEKFYRYYFGRGGTGYSHISLKSFERYCTMASIADKMEIFLKKKDALDTYGYIVEKNRGEQLNDCFFRWDHELAEEDKAKAFDLMLQHWRTDEVIGTFAKKYFYDRLKAARLVRKASSLQYNKCKIRTVAAYYHSCANGGVERVLCELCDLWVKMGYRVIVLTDEQPSENDYILPDNVKRITVPAYTGITENNYAVRSAALQQIIRDNEIDAVVYHAWAMHLMLWDELTIKASGAAFIAHCHSVFSVGLLDAWNDTESIAAPYELADAVVTLSETDKAFWKHYSGNVHVTINPFTDSLENWTPEYHFNNHRIVWCGRLSDEKNPYDTLSIMKEVVKKVPDAVLMLVGEGKTPRYSQNLQKKINSMGLAEHIFLKGFHKDVKSFYLSSQIFLMTSSYEGYPLALLESQMAGLPCVMYELPYLTLCEQKLGFIPVDQRDIKAAADVLVDLLTDEELCSRCAHDARAHIESFFAFDFNEKWRQIFESVEQEHDAAVSKYDKIMMDTLLKHHQIGLQKVRGVSTCKNAHTRGNGSLIIKVGKAVIPKSLHQKTVDIINGIPWEKRLAIRRFLHW